MARRKITLSQSFIYKFTEDELIKKPARIKSIMLKSAGIISPLNYVKFDKHLNPISVPKKLHKQNTEAIGRILVEGLPAELRAGIARDIFPKMRADMINLISKMQSQKNGGVWSRSGIKSQKNFKYTKISQAKTSKQIYFENISLHIGPLMTGVKSKKGPWYVGDWVKRLANAGKITSPALQIYKSRKQQKKEAGKKGKDKKFKRKKFPEYIMGIGETTRRINTKKTKINKILSNIQTNYYNIQNGKGYKNRIKDLKKLNSKSLALQKSLKKAQGKKFSALVKGKSERNFFTPVVEKYFGEMRSLPRYNVHPGLKSGNAEVVNNLSDSIVLSLEKKVKKLKKQKQKR